MHLNKNHTFSRRALAMLLTLTLCLSLVPSAFAAQQNSYHDPAEHWMQASNRTNELDVNSVVTRETFKCGECGKVTSFEVFRVPEYTRNGQTALSRNVKYSDGTMMDGVGKGDCMDGVPGKDAYYTGYHYTKAVCETCGGINTNEPKSDYGYLKNVYWLFDCAAEFTQKLEETVTYEYTDDTYHTVTTKGGTYCAFCYGTNHTVNSTLERHSMETEVLPQPANGRFATVEKCSLCDYASYDYTAAKAVIADYYGVVDGQPHTITVSDLSEAGVRTSIRYGNSAESCTMTSAPNYTEEGQYTVYYEITYTYQNVSMTENGVANVWLRDTQASEDGKCTCGCDDPNCGCKDKNCGGNCCSDKGCGENHHFILLDRTKAGCITLGYMHTSNIEYRVEMVTPKLTYAELPKLQECVRQVRHAGAKANISCGIHVHVDAANHNRQSLKNLLSIMYSKEDILFKALQVNERRASRWCQKVREPMLKEARKLSSDETKNLTALESIWYEGNISDREHYNWTRYYALNLHSVFYRGTVEWRCFNSTLHAGKIAAYVNLCLAMSAQAINQRSTVMRKTMSDNELFTFRVWLVRLGLNGEEFKNTRNHLLANLDGDRAWRYDKDSYEVNKKKKKSREMER